MTMRSGSAMTRCSSYQAAPECSDRLIQPSASGVETAAAMTRGWNCSTMGEKRRKSDGMNSTLAPESRRNRSAGP